MSWLEVDLNELETEKQEQKGRSKFDIEPGAYELTLGAVYISQTKNGATYFGLQGAGGTFPDDYEINLDGFSVERMVKNKDGSAKMSNGRYFTGVLFLDEMMKCFNKNVNAIKLTEDVVTIFGKQEKVGIIKELFGKKIVIGIRDREHEYNGEIKTKKELLGVCCVTNKECIDKLKKRIAKTPVYKEKNKKLVNTQTTVDTLNDPF